MADLSELQSSLPTKITGANPSTGVTTNFLQVQSDGSVTARLDDTAGNGITSTLVSSHQTLDVNAVQTGTWNITNVSGTVSLPTGAATSALQTTGNTSLATIATAVTLAQGSTTSGQTGALTLAAVTTASPTYTTGQTSALSLTTAGALRVDASATTQPVSGTVTANQGGSWTVAATQSGTWTTGRTWTLASGTDSISAVQSGAWNITNITGTISLPTGAATSALQTTGNTSLSTIATTLTLAQGSTTSGQTGSLTMGAVTTAAPTYTTAQTSPISLNTSGGLRVDGSGVTQPVSGTVAATQSGTWTVQPGNTPNTTPWLVTDSSDGPVTPGTVAAKSSLIGGQFNTTLPTLTTGQQSAVQLDASGRVIIAPLTNASIVKAQLEDNAGNGITSSSDGTAGNQLLHVQTPDTTTASTALGALNATVSIAMAGLASVGFQLAAGTLVGTIVPECSLDGGTTWITCSFYNISTSSISTSVVFGSANTLTILSVLPIGGASNVRVRVSAYTSGTANGLMRASQVTGAAGAITSAAFGTVSNTYVSLTANTTTQLLASNTARRYAYISNNSGSLIAIQFGSATGLTSAARGLVIPNGDFYELKGDNLYTGAIFAYTNSSGVVIAVTEGTP